MRFRFFDLLATIAIAAILLGATLAVRYHAQETSVIAQCAGNLRRIAESLVLYQGLYSGQFPRTRYEPDAAIAGYTNPDASDPFASNGPVANDVTASAFLLARVLEVTPDVFVCPAAIRNGLAQTDSFDRASAKERSNFRARLNYNYALANMYPDAAATTAGYSLDHFLRKLPPTFAIAGDTNPGGAALQPPKIGLTGKELQNEMRLHNSPNHQRDGQNLLFADSSVRFVGSAIEAAGGDDPYRSQGTFPQPANAGDVVLLPTWDVGPNLTSTNVIVRRWSLVGAVGFTVIVMGGILWRGMRRREPTAS